MRGTKPCDGLDMKKSSETFAGLLLPHTELMTHIAISVN